LERHTIGGLFTVEFEFIHEVPAIESIAKIL